MALLKWLGNVKRVFLGGMLVQSAYLYDLLDRFGVPARGDSYRVNPWAHGAIKLLGRSIASAPFRIYEGDPKKPRDVADHQIAKLFERPNPTLTRAQVWLATVIYLEQCGECFWLMVGRVGRYAKGEDPYEIWPQDPRWFRPLDELGQEITSPMQRPAKWRLVVEGVRPIDFEPHELLHFRYFDPANPHRGLPPSEIE
ncbi:MAG TPA: phage portal protein, partial [Reyranella sp.]|nr:phage portal protein [Reyranella sp.]